MKSLLKVQTHGETRFCAIFCCISLSHIFNIDILKPNFYCCCVAKPLSILFRFEYKLQVTTLDSHRARALGKQVALTQEIRSYLKVKVNGIHLKHWVLNDCFHNHLMRFYSKMDVYFKIIFE